MSNSEGWIVCNSPHTEYHLNIPLWTFQDMFSASILNTDSTFLFFDIHWSYVSYQLKWVKPIIPANRFPLACFLPGRLHMVFSSPRHLMVAGGCIIILEIVYKMNFSLLGFLICSAFWGFGI